MNNKKRLIGTVLAAIMILSTATSALPLSGGIETGICAASDDKQNVGGAEDTRIPQLAPLNPDFVAYWENPPEIFFGDVPPPMDLSHLDQLPVEGLLISDALPDSFDWRDYGKVTPVKNQTPCGTCWDFAATSALESSVLIGESVAYNFSEQSVALCVDRSWVYLYDDWDDPCNAGGTCWLASEVFIRKGSVLETCNPYNGYALQCDGSCVCDSCSAIKNVDGFRVAAWDGSQIDTIKNAIYNKGPAKLSYNHSYSYEYWDPTWGAIYDYYPCPGGTNHAVTVVGWDDDVPHPNPSHGGTGAWIIKNSWGTSNPWAGGAGISDGYFYLAYNSSCVQRIIHLEYKDPVSGEELLYWDEAGQVSAVGYGDNDAWMASVFTADQASDLTHVDFWTTSNNAQYEIYVWDGFFGTQLAHQTGTCSEDGYYSIALSAPISIDAGQQFTVGVDMTTPGYNYPIPIEKEISGEVEPPIQSNVSFIRHTGSDSWKDLADYGDNACLRARIISGVAEPDIWVNPTSFDVTLPTDTIYSTNLTIGNDGNATLIYDIADTEGGSVAQEFAAKTESSNAKLKDLTQKVEYPIGNIPSLEKVLSLGEHEISYDDGEVDSYHWWLGAGGAFGVHFTSPTYNTLSTVRFYIYSKPATFDWKVLSWTGSQPGSVIASGTTTPTSSGWHDVDVGGISVPSDFVIAIYWREANRPTLGSDNDPPIAYRSWDYNAVEWSLENTKDYMIRAVMYTEEGWLSESPTNGTVEPKTQTNITVTFNTTGLSTGDYYANIIISNNDPDENPTIVPVNLTVGEPEPFDTGTGTYPSIMGTHNGTITPNQTISVSKMYTYPCTGTGGHSEYVAFYYTDTAGTGTVLIIDNDNDPYFGDDQSVDIFNTTFKDMGYDVTIEKSAETSYSTWSDYDLVVWSCGDDNTSVKQPEYREMLVDYITDGGHLIIEGGDISECRAFTAFAKKVLHILNKYVYCDVGDLTISTPHPITTTPNALPDTIGFTPTNPGDLSADADAVRILPNATGVYNWSYVNYGSKPVNESVARISYGLIAYDNDADVTNGGQIVYYAFDVDDIDNPDTQRELIENSENWLRGVRGEKIASGTWNGYQGAGDYHYIEFEKSFVLEKDVTYNYSIQTGSYPQIHHTPALPTANGWINCTKFTDANGKEYTDWIPAIKLE